MSESEMVFLGIVAALIVLFLILIIIPILGWLIWRFDIAASPFAISIFTLLAFFVLMLIIVMAANRIYLAGLAG